MSRIAGFIEHSPRLGELLLDPGEACAPGGVATRRLLLLGLGEALPELSEGRERAALRRSWQRAALRQLRDPAIYVEDGAVYLLYAVAGESGIAIAEVTLD